MRSARGPSGSSSPVKKARVEAPKVLGRNFEVARGRGRLRQLQTMSQEQKDAETKWRLEKNRIAARESRAKKRTYHAELEAQLAAFKAENEWLRAELQRLTQIGLR
jgi:hypothetical protein